MLRLACPKIESSLAGRQKQAQGLVCYIAGQSKRAAEEDEEDGDNLKRQGLIVNAHIPIGPSHLDIDPQVLQSYGASRGPEAPPSSLHSRGAHDCMRVAECPSTFCLSYHAGKFGEHLLNAHALVAVSQREVEDPDGGGHPTADNHGHASDVLNHHASITGSSYPTLDDLRATAQANREALLRRSGRLPVADGLKTYNLAELMYVEPHYYQSTANLDLRKGLTMQTRCVGGVGSWAGRRGAGSVCKAVGGWGPRCWPG
jgi:hypothetical protein